jgi:hypothetical protein
VDEGVGYHATHYLVQLRPETLHKDELRYADTNIEIQVASVLMHAWAEVTHDLTYKPTKGALTPTEMRLVQDLNDIVQAGEAKLEQLQESVEGRSGGQDLRFELTASLTALAERLAAQSKGQDEGRIGVYDVFRVARQASQSGKIEAGVSVYDSYLKSKLAIWKVHKADELDDRLRAYNESLKTTLPPRVPGEEVFVYQALEQLHPGTKDVTSLPSKEQSDVFALSQELKRRTQS